MALPARRLPGPRAVGSAAAVTPHWEKQNRSPRQPIILFPGTDFLFRRYLPKMSLLPLGNPLQKIGITSPHSLHPPPLLKGGEGRGEEGSYIHVPCPFGALLVTLYQILAKGF